jgi:hypothetical protein
LALKTWGSGPGSQDLGFRTPTHAHMHRLSDFI